MLASFMLFVDFDAVTWDGVKFRGRACQRRDHRLKYIYLEITVLAIISIKVISAGKRI